MAFRLINVKIAEPAPLKKVRLVLLAILFKEFHSFLYGYAFTLKGQPLAHQQPHFCLYPAGVLLREHLISIAYGYKQTGAKGIPYPYPCRRIQLPHSHYEHKLKGALIYPPAHLIPIAQQVHIGILVWGKAQAEHLSRYLGGKGPLRKAYAVQPRHAHSVKYGFTALNAYGFTVYVHIEIHMLLSSWSVRLYLC